METAQKFTRYETTEYNRSERVLSKLQDIYSAARVYHSTHAQILERLGAEVYRSRDWEKLTPYYRGMYHGALRILAKGLYRDLAWRVYLDGALVKSEDVPKGRWCDVVADKGAHVWTDAPERVF